jgi:hypothetical protein
MMLSVVCISHSYIEKCNLKKKFLVLLQDFESKTSSFGVLVINQRKIMLLLENLEKVLFQNIEHCIFKKQNWSLKKKFWILYWDFGTKTWSFAVFMDRTTNNHVFARKSWKKCFLRRLKIAFLFASFCKSKKSWNEYCFFHLWDFFVN